MTNDDPVGWEGDVNESVVEEWLESTTKFERVRGVLRSTTTPQYAKEIANRARVSEPTARKHLETLAETGFAETVATGRGKRYKRSRQAVAMQRVSDIHRELSREELTAGIKDLRAQIREFRDEFDASDPGDLAFQLESDANEGWEAVSEWRAAENDLEVAKAALALYDFDPDAGSGEEGGSDSTQRGSFADETLDASA
ncbi:winged helix-turn-helix domain-containing protein [Haloterrigena alkaliphila]|uniref:Winged helix-turn-helix transcriptional regulator n=1 Tax=Haloterrigena alkaliphila TaxID=2816475 RepID=A0A8A2VG28_9EURY|nr:winged helix-turn-helix domain-containing protein [Haloterrigena alkaliphila]QSX01010.1 winged helix-turn-helix domain-containing protein [Haloterrigena alkaliphila]